MPADQLSTDSTAQTAEDIEAVGQVDSYGLLRDGTMITVWADMRTYDSSSDLVRRAFRLRSSSGDETLGRLPAGKSSIYAEQPVVVSTRHGFVVAGEPAVLVEPDGTVRAFRTHPGARLKDGDVLAPAGRGFVRLLRPGSVTDHVLAMGSDSVPLTAAGGNVYAFHDLPSSRGLPGPVRIGSWQGGGWTSHDVGDAFDIEVVADGDHAAAWACNEGGHGSGGDSRSCGSYGFAVTRDGGATWQDLSVGERPFEQLDQAVAANGHLFVKGWPGGFWRSTDESWTSFARFSLPARARLHAEDGFISASVEGRRSLTILRLNDDGAPRRPVVVNIPRDDGPQLRDPTSAEPIGSDDGTLLLRLLDDGGTETESQVITSEGARTTGTWRWPTGLSQGFLVLDPRDIDSATMLTSAGELLPTSIGQPGHVRSGDALVTTTAPARSAVRPKKLWSFRAADQTFREVTAPTVRDFHHAAVDGRGRAWLMQADTLWRSDDGASSWTSTRLPWQPDPWEGRTSLQVAGSRVLVFLHSPRPAVRVSPPFEAIRVLSPRGTWSTVSVPPRLSGAGDVRLLSDGRLLLGPIAGQFWRSVSPANKRFEGIAAGPIAQVAVAGDLLYGIALSPPGDDRTPLPLATDRETVWVSRDHGTTWAELQ